MTETVVASVATPVDPGTRPLPYTVALVSVSGLC